LVTKLKAKPLHYCPISFAGKIGYGTVSESLACKKSLVFVRRDHFNEEPFLRKMLEVHPTLRRLLLNLLMVYSLLLTFEGWHVSIGSFCSITVEVWK
jgi:hypothetical protein